MVALLVFGAPESVCHAEATEAQPTPVVRYHFGDDPDGKKGWADPKFDDSAWPVAKQDHLPTPPFYSDGVMWVRARVPVPSNVVGPLALGIVEELGTADELFVSGVPIGRQSALPSLRPVRRPNLRGDAGRETIFDLPPGTVLANLGQAGAATLVAVRAWFPPLMRETGRFGATSFQLGDRHSLRLAARANRYAALLAIGPELAMNGLILILGIGLLVLWRLDHEGELLVFSLMLIGLTLFGLGSDLYGLLPMAIPWRAYLAFLWCLSLFPMGCSTELIWRVHAIPNLAMKRLCWAAAIVFVVSSLVAVLATNASLFVHLSVLAIFPAVRVFNFLTISVNVWAIFVRRSNRLFAVAFSAIPIAEFVNDLGIRQEMDAGIFHVSSFSLAAFSSELVLLIMLGGRAWQAWRVRDEARFELEAAREVQQQLVMPVSDLPGFKIESVYAPAKQVGGDFFRIIPEADFGLLVVVGDVSGKGLRAAMTVSTIVGALRTLTPSSPAEILGTLNRGLVGHLHGGFVTCCVARISGDGSATVANAGHLSPYLNGNELELTAGLPLGIAADVVYEESLFTIHAGVPLTFVSDGIVEARNVSGELFGFDRMLQVSNSGADAIANAAISFGQDDDITVVTITRVAVQDHASAQMSVRAILPSTA